MVIHIKSDDKLLIKIEELEKKFAEFTKMKKGIDPKKESVKIIFIYLVMGSLWITLSDRLAAQLFEDVRTLALFSTWKGWLYVLVTGWIFYGIIFKSLVLYRDSIVIIYNNYEELSSAHEELIGIEEELSEKYDELEQSYHKLSLSDQKYKLAVDGAKDGIWEWDIKEDRYLFSEKWLKYCGYDPWQIKNTIDGWKGLLHPEDADEAERTLKEYLNSGNGGYQNIYRIRCAEGSYKTILSKGVCIWDEEGNPVRMAGSHTDITQQMMLQESLREEKEFSDNVIKESAVIIMLLSLEGEILRFNDFARGITGYADEEIKGKKVFELFPRNKQDKIKGLYREIITGENANSIEEKIITKNNKAVDVLWSFSPLHDNVGNTRGIILNGTDITERKEMERRLYHAAYYDELTQLPNRAMFNFKVEEKLSEIKGTNDQMALLYLDIDNFKHINEIYGYIVGDELLRYVASVLSHTVSSEGITARLSGDEFIVSMEGIKGVDDVIDQINEINYCLSKPWIHNGQEFYINISCGVAIYPKDGDNLGTLLKRADLAVFSAKEQGKNSYCLFAEEMEDKSKKYMEMDNMLRKAILGNEFTLHYQPQVDATNGKIKKLEALIRWNHPERGFISPEEFIPIAEQTGHIEAIGEWVVEEACRQIKSWKGKGITTPKVSINLSSTMLSRQGISEKSIETINRSIQNVDVEFEITETAILTNEKNVLKALDIMKKNGITIALDDFGTGYSSLNHLQNLPIDVLKIDSSFLMNIHKSDKEKSLYESVIQLAHSLELEVVAEGVETKEQVEFLKENKCDTLQGYYFSRPLPPDKAEVIIANGFIKI
ncbi:bifunctional diguanylate cyclase/phosphodiesterase [Alkalibacter saccharofermentans]|uniref:PAS domain S-box-containing protein/diguanylate cyclase (GGDEF) domain-containing protein n=1 Tax=Alkalibacter saccharofermentans DSM 14828 TaxID=1120975 RepID=A0A1M4VJB8_9FIRM|nr:GGDEF domain-containing phosphodiesterase [Alkalibacter saccharofermentans]SHE69166.1 PAS domain S-box-containing protein/diguanylate cyclase (GGDEF) domain-containing protein [Alkalibacter saccharofermentans DSM 14828]